jgi:hypothetical protein
MNITSTTYPEAFAAMDAAASEFWAYPDQDWQENFLRQWAQANDPVLLAALEA